MPNDYQFYTADVFTDRIFGGNPLAVFTDARGLDTARMHQITREMNLSETVFVLPPETPRGTRRVRIFTPGRELPFAGHPTVGTAFVLASIGEIPLSGDLTHIVLEEGVGPVEVRIRSRNGRPIVSELSAAKLPEEGPPPPSNEKLAAVLSLQAAQIAGGTRRPRSFSCGVPFLFVMVRDLTALASARPNLELWERHLANYSTQEVYVVTESPDADIRARMFAPTLGIPEDPATGSAASALAGYLAPAGTADGLLRWTVRQGVEMGRPSTIEVEADVKDGALSAVRVGGSSVMVSRGVVTLPIEEE